MGICLAALIFRVWTPWNIVFDGQAVRFQQIDAYYYQRLVENFLAHPPWLIFHDPYAVAGSDGAVTVAPMFAILLGLTAWISPAPATVTIAIIPAFLGAAAPAIVYFITRRLTSSGGAGLMAAAILAVLPGAWLRASQLGSADHHVLEGLLASVVLAAWMRAIDSEQLRDAALAGLALWAYLATWVGGALIVAILVGWSCVQCGLDLWQGRRVGYLGRIAVVAFGLAALGYLPLRHVYLWNFTMAALGGGLLTGALFWAVDRGVSWPRALGFSSLILAAALGAVRLTSPDFLPFLWYFLQSYAMGSGWRNAIVEVRPLFYLSDEFSWIPQWIYFTGTFAISCLALPWLLLVSVRRPAPKHLLLAFWSLVMLAATLGQNRMAYYFAANAAVLTALAFHYVWRHTAWRGRATASAALALLVFLPAINHGRNQMQISNAPSDAWHEAMEWIAAHTPEPFGDPSFFRARYTGPAATPWSVAVWCDYGYLVSALGRRIPSSNPTHIGVDDTAAFYTATDEGQALEALRKLRARYVVVDPSIPFHSTSPSNKFGAMLPFARRSPDRFYGHFFARAGAGYRSVTFYFPEYFESMAARLYLFDGQQAAATDVWVIQYMDQDLGGRHMRAITEAKQFKSYEEALRYQEELLEKPRVTTVRIASVDPAKSCVPVKPLAGFRLVHQAGGAGTFQRVKVFEVINPMNARSGR